MVVVGAVGLALGGQPAGPAWRMPSLFLLLGTWAFVALALLLAGTVRAEGVLAVANPWWVLLLVVGGVVAPRCRAARGRSPRWSGCSPPPSATGCARPWTGGGVSSSARSSSLPLGGGGDRGGVTDVPVVGLVATLAAEAAPVIGPRCASGLGR